MATLDLGIVAHVDAGKTSLTERLLFDAGVIDSIGGVDTGTTQTDTDDLERSRGITIRAAVVAFELDDLHVNLIDTPGHSDFIAEVERSLAVLDAAVLVVSAVEGVQAQTRVLMRTLDRLQVPTMIFVNKVDRMGARAAELITELRTAWSDGVLPMTEVAELGTRTASVTRLPDDRDESINLLTELDETLLAAYVERGGFEVDAAIAELTASCQLHPAYFGSAITGAGVDHFAEGLRRYLAPRPARTAGSLHAQVFKIDRDDSGQKLAYVRIRSGSLSARDHLDLHSADTDPVKVRPTAVEPFVRGTRTVARPAVAGDIAKVWGLPRAKIGDQLGHRDRIRPARLARPGLESVVTPARREDRIRLHTALQVLAEQDPLINTHLTGDDIAVSLYGEVQGQVLQDRLSRDFGIDAAFAPARTVYLEQPVGVGTAVERMAPGAPFAATIGLRVEPGPSGTGAVYRDATAPGHMPVAFHTAIEETVWESLRQGIHGWQLTDCVVTLVERDYSPPGSTGGDFRHLTPLVLAAAIRSARTRVQEPLNAFEIDAPADALRSILRLMTGAGAALSTTEVRADRCEITGELPSAQVYRVGQLLPGLTRGDAAFLARPGGHRQVRGRPPRRKRTDGNPYNRKEYLMFLAS